MVFLFSYQITVRLYSISCLLHLHYIFSSGCSGKINEVPLFERDLRGQEEIHGRNHPDTIFAKNLVKLLIQQELDEANELELKYNI